MGLPQVERRHRYPGRRRLPDRKVLSGILFVLYTGSKHHLITEGAGIPLAVRLTGGNRTDVTSSCGSGLGVHRWVVEQTVALLVPPNWRH